MNRSDLKRDLFMLKGALSKKGYDWWWHNFTGYRLWNGGTGFGEIKLYQKQGHKSILIDHIKMENAGCEYGEYSCLK